MTLDIEHLLTELTLEEKASLTSGSGFWCTAADRAAGDPEDHGLRRPARPAGPARRRRPCRPGGSLPAPAFPTASAIASRGTPTCCAGWVQALAQEARACNLSVILGPGINMKRSPLCGRNFEYFSEDPFLAGELAVGIVDGIQSRRRRHVGQALRGQQPGGPTGCASTPEVDERTLREIYLPAFERVVKASQPWTVMCSYNKVNGLSASENRWLLTSVLREEFGFDGLVVSDWGAVYDRVPALLAGLDLEMPPALGRSPQQIVAAVEAGAVLDRACSMPGSAPCSSWSAKGMPVLDADGVLRRRRPPRAGPRRRRRVRGAAEERGPCCPCPRTPRSP